MRGKYKGFSTAEVLITIMLFSFGILPLVVLFQNSHKQSAQAKNLIIAQSIGRSMISEIRSLGFDYILRVYKEPNVNDVYKIIHNKKEVEGSLVPSDNDSIVYPEYYKRFKTSVRIEPIGNDGEENKIRVELDVEWQEPNMRKLDSERNFTLGFGTVLVKYDT